jgi:hypothetical protein
LILRNTCVFIGLAFLASHSKADIITDINADGGVDTRAFAVLYEGGSGNQLHISGTAETINGNIGIGGTGTIKLNGSGTLNGTVDFSSPYNGTPGSQCSSDSSFNFSCSSANYPNYPTNPNPYDKNVSADLNGVATFSSNVASIASGAPSETITSGQTFYVNSTTANCTSYAGNCVVNVNPLTFSSSAGSTIVINSQVAGANVILNFTTSSDVQINGNITYAGFITSPDQLAINVTGGGGLKIVDATINGDYIDPNGSIFVSGSTLNGRIFGGDNSGMSLVSGVNINAATPEPAAIVLVVTVMLGLLPLLRRKLKRAAPSA